jgi:hypothetical protein
MNIEDNLILKTNVRLELFDKDKNLKDIVRAHNTVTLAGKYGIMDQILTTTSLAKPGWMELGTGTGGSNVLQSYIAGSRTALDSKTRINDVVTMICTFPAGVGAGLLKEAGVFDIATANTPNMWMYVNFTATNKLPTDILIATWTLTQG